MNTPARRLKKSAVKNIVRFPSIKANDGKTILVESLLESKYCLHLEFDPIVKTYSPQPRKFRITSEDGEDDIYTPDFEVVYISGDRKYVEVKPLERIRSPHYQSLFSRFESSLENTNAGFLLVDEIEIYSEPLLSNYEKLYQYRKRPTLDMKSLYRCADQIIGVISLAQLVSELGDRVSLREVYSWLAMGYLQFEMRSEHLTMTTKVSFDVS